MVTHFFGTKAGKVWHSLMEGPKTLSQLQKSTGMTLKEVSMGLGWLAREGKVRMNDTESMAPRFEVIE